MAARFDAFLSYSRRASTTLATELQSAVQRFATPWYRLRTSRVFRDDTTLSANTGLWSAIEAALQDSEWFVLLASPGAAASRWVGEEIAWWLEHKSPERILLVLDEGALVWDDATNAFDPERSTALPPALRSAFWREPRWVDLTWFELPDSAGRNDPRWTARVADVAAAIRFAERDELEGANVRERRRALNLLRIGIAGLSVLLVASLVATVFAVNQSNAATTQARVSLAGQLAAQAESQAASDLPLASLLAVEAWRTDQDPQTRDALFQMSIDSSNLVRTLQVGSQVDATAMTPAGAVVSGSDDGDVSLWVDGKRTHLAKLGHPTGVVAVSDDHRVVAAMPDEDADDVTIIRNGMAVAVPAVTPRQDVTPSVAMSADGSLVAVSDGATTTVLLTWNGTSWTAGPVVAAGGRLGVGDGTITIFDPQGGWAVASTSDGGILRSGSLPVLGYFDNTAVSGDGSRISGETETGFPVWNTTEGAPLVGTARQATPEDMALSRDGLRVAVLRTDGVIDVSTPDIASATPVTLSGTGTAFGTLSFGGDDRLANAKGDTVQVWDLSRTDRVDRIAHADLPTRCAACGSLALHYSPDAARLAVDGFADGPVLLDPVTGKTAAIASGSGIQRMQWDGAKRIIGFSASDSAIEVRSGAGFGHVDEKVPMSLGTATVTLVAQHGERAIVVTDDAHYRVIDLAKRQVGPTRDLLTKAERADDWSTAYSVAVAPDLSTVVAVAALAVLRVIDPLTGRKLMTLKGAESGSYDASGTLHLFFGLNAGTYDAASHKLVNTFPIDAPSFLNPVVDPDGSLAVDDGAEERVTITDLRRFGVVFSTFSVPQFSGLDQMSSAFAPDARSLVMVLPPTGDATTWPIRVMDLNPAHWIRLACEVAGRDLTAQEWQRYAGSPPPADLRCTR